MAINGTLLLVHFCSNGYLLIGKVPIRISGILFDLDCSASEFKIHEICFEIACLTHYFDSAIFLNFRSSYSSDLLRYI